MHVIVQRDTCGLVANVTTFWLYPPARPHLRGTRHLRPDLRPGGLNLPRHTLLDAEPKGLSASRHTRRKGTRGFTTPGRALSPWQAAAGHLRAACRDLAFALCLLAPVLALAAPTGATPDASSDAGKASEEKPLIFLSEAAHPPYAYWGPKGEMVGFEINEEHREKFTLSDPYFRMPILFVARKDAMPNALTPEALADQSLGALRDSPYASLAQERFPKSPLSTYATQIEANLDLAADRVDLVIGDEMSLRDWLKTAPEASCCAAAGRVEDPTRIAGEGFGVVMRKGDDALKARIDGALKEVRSDGTYATIARKYFDFDL
jgi:ABC-type amino acid transport substrate-binding protein